MIQNDVNGILVDPNDRELGLSNAMEMIISNQKLRHKIAKILFLQGINIRLKILSKNGIAS